MGPGMDEEKFPGMKRREVEECAVREVRGEVGTLSPYGADQLLDVARKMEEYVNSHGWSWCMMDRVYKILKTIHG